MQIDVTTSKISNIHLLNITNVLLSTEAIIKFLLFESI